jgi:GNAT superfamily N-acetyltransferase
MLQEPLSNYSIRYAKPQEAAFISALAFRSKQHWDYTDEFMEKCRQDLTYSSDEIEHATAIVVDVEGVIVGFYVLEEVDAEKVELEALFIEPNLIGFGYGALLIEDAKKRAAETGFSKMLLQSDPYAEAFCAKAGAVLIGKRQSDSIAGRFLPLMEIQL